jgi:hypothetical protein
LIVKALTVAMLAWSAARGFAQAAPSPVVLWGGLRTGMTPAQVRDLFPSAEPIADPQADAGYLTTLLTAAPPAYGHPGRALLRFHNDRLFSVRLDVLSLKAGERAQNVKLAAEMIADLSKLAPSYDCADNSRADVKLMDCKWLRDGAAVRLEYMDVAGQAPELKVLFSPVSDVGSDL